MELSAKQKIVLATIECIEKEGIRAVTIRSIGKEAGVNSAAINYYFGSKEKLVEEAFNHIQQDFMMDYTQIINKDKDLKTVIEELLLYMLQGMVRYPNIAKAILYDPFVNNKYDSIFISKINALCQELNNRINKGSSKTDESKIAVNQFIASTLYMGILSNTFKSFMAIDLSNEDVLKDYVRKVAEVFIKAIS